MPTMNGQKGLDDRNFSLSTITPDKKVQMFTALLVPLDDTKHSFQLFSFTILFYYLSPRSSAHNRCHRSRDIYALITAGTAGVRSC